MVLRALINIKLPLGSTCRKLKQNESFSISHNIVLKTEVNADLEVTTEEKKLTTIVIDRGNN